jgi:hypothetical protein
MVVTLVAFASRRHVVRMTCLFGAVSELPNRHQFAGSSSLDDRGWTAGLARPPPPIRGRAGRLLEILHDLVWRIWPAERMIVSYVTEAAAGCHGKPVRALVDGAAPLASLLTCRGRQTKEVK